VSCLGLSFDAKANRIVFHEPVLPAFLNDVTLRGLRLAGGRTDIAARRVGKGVVIDVLERPPSVGVLTIN
jgi:hypothetical protein